MTAVVRDARGRPRLDWAIDAEARSVLGSCTAVDRDVLWAVGAVELHHAWDFTAFPPDPSHFAPINAGSQLPCGRWYGAGRSGWRVWRLVRTETTLTEEDVMRGGWREVAAQATAARVGTGLVAEIAAALAERARLAVALHDPERLGPLDGWADIERACYLLAARVWDRLRPDWALFDLAGAA